MALSGLDPRSISNSSSSLGIQSTLNTNKKAETANKLSKTVDGAVDKSFRDFLTALSERNPDASKGLIQKLERIAESGTDAKLLILKTFAPAAFKELQTSGEPDVVKAIKERVDTRPAGPEVTRELNTFYKSLNQSETKFLSAFVESEVKRANGN